MQEWWMFRLCSHLWPAVLLENKQTLQHIQRDGEKGTECEEWGTYQQKHRVAGKMTSWSRQIIPASCFCIRLKKMKVNCLLQHNTVWRNKSNQLTWMSKCVADVWNAHKLFSGFVSIMCLFTMFNLMLKKGAVVLLKWCLLQTANVQNDPQPLYLPHDTVPQKRLASSLSELKCLLMAFFWPMFLPSTWS